MEVHANKDRKIESMKLKRYRMKPKLQQESIIKVNPGKFKIKIKCCLHTNSLTKTVCMLMTKV